MPGDLEGSPALTFAPLPLDGEAPARPGSLRAMMERRYEAYKTHVVRPFFREHFARLDRQIVLVDALQALNAGPAAMADLERALTEILACFRTGRGSFLTDLFSHRIDRILFAATKADHLHHESHDRLQAIVRRIADRAIKRADFSGAEVDVLALAAVRATREGTVKQGRETLPVIIGTPLAGETIGGETFDGKTETAVFPGDLPENARDVFASERRCADDRIADPLRALPPAAARAHGRGRDPVAAAHPARPRPAVPARRPPRMTAPRRPASFGVTRRRARRQRRTRDPQAPTAAQPSPRRPSRIGQIRSTIIPAPIDVFDAPADDLAPACRTDAAPRLDRHVDLHGGLRHPRLARARPLDRPADPRPVRPRRPGSAGLPRASPASRRSRSSASWSARCWALSRLASIGTLRRAADGGAGTRRCEGGAAVVARAVRPVADQAGNRRRSPGPRRPGRRDHRRRQPDPRLPRRNSWRRSTPRAKTLILDAAKRVSVVTAVSPRALVDLAYVVFEAGRLIRRLAELYGGRPGTLGFFRLARSVLAHLAVTGSIAAGDDFVHQIVGQGLAARLSAKLGEGVVNGMMTARIGIAAMEAARPLPFAALKRPGHGAISLSR